MSHRFSPAILSAVLISLLLTSQAPLLAQGSAGTRILFITTAKDHPYGSHMYNFDSRLLAACLNQHRGVEAIVRSGFPQDPAELEGLAAIVFFSKPAGEMVLDPRNREKFTRLMQSGAGFVAIHWGTGIGYSKFAEAEEIRNAYLDVLGAWFRRPPCGVTIAQAELAQVDSRHPICRGWLGYELRGEYYTDLVFHDRAKPLVTVNVEGKDQVVGWTFERADGGRSYGTTLGHFHYNFIRPMHRRMVVNGILWAAQHRIPLAGSKVQLPVGELNLPPTPAESSE